MSGGSNTNGNSLENPRPRTLYAGSNTTKRALLAEQIADPTFM